MKYFWETLRIAFISLEAVYVLFIFLLLQLQPKPFEILGERLTSDAAITNWLPVLPIGVSTFCFINLIWKIITPLSGSNSELHQWPDFWRLKIRSYYSLILSAICAAVALAIWVFSKTIPHVWIGTVFSLAMGISLINVGCMMFASYTIRIILEPKK